MNVRFIRNFLNGQHIIHKIRQVQTVRLTFLHQRIKNEWPPAAVLSLGARAASNWPSQRSKRLNDYRNKRKANQQLNEGTSSQCHLQHNQQLFHFWHDENAGSCGSCASSGNDGGGGGGGGHHNCSD